MRRQARRTAWVLALLVVAAAAVVGCDHEGRGPTRIRISLILGDTSEWYQGAVRWKELVEGASQGRYKIEVIPNATRSGRNQSTELQMVQQGQLEASLESTILLSTVDPRWTVFSFPGLFPSHAIANAVCGGPVGTDMLDLLQDRNIVGLAYGVNGFRQITNSVRPLRTAEDLEGLKLRVPQGLPPEIFERFGASAHQMNFGDLYLALDRGDMHGQENPLSVIHTAKLHAVQKHITLWNLVYDPIVLCVNRDFWYQLPGDDQKLLRRCAVEAMRHERQLVAESDETLPAELEAAGMTVTRLTAIQADGLKARAQTLRPLFEGKVGRELLDRFEAAVREEIEKAKAKASEEEAAAEP